MQLKLSHFKVPLFPPLDLSGRHNEAIYPAMTDSGICHVYNGNAMRSTYVARRADTPNSGSLFDLDKRCVVMFTLLIMSLRLRAFRRQEFAPKKIKGTGKVSEKTFWLNVADRYYYGLKATRSS